MACSGYYILTWSFYVQRRISFLFNTLTVLVGLGPQVFTQTLGANSSFFQLKLFHVSDNSKAWSEHPPLPLQLGSATALMCENHFTSPCLFPFHLLLALPIYSLFSLKQTASLQSVHTIPSSVGCPVSGRAVGATTIQIFNIKCGHVLCSKGVQPLALKAM